MFAKVAKHEAFEFEVQSSDRAYRFCSDDEAVRIKSFCFARLESLFLYFLCKAAKARPLLGYRAAGLRIGKCNMQVMFARHNALGQNVVT